MLYPYPVCGYSMYPCVTRRRAGAAARAAVAPLAPRFQHPPRCQNFEKFSTFDRLITSSLKVNFRRKFREIWVVKMTKIETKFGWVGLERSAVRNLPPVFDMKTKNTVLTRLPTHWMTSPKDDQGGNAKVTSIPSCPDLHNSTAAHASTGHCWVKSHIRLHQRAVFDADFHECIHSGSSLQSVPNALSN